MTDLNKLREEFERLQHIADKLDLVYYCEDTNYYAEKSGYNLRAVPSFVNGAWYAYQEQQTKLDKAQKDVERIDFLADKEQWIVNVQMPREIAERNLTSLRDAIDEAIALVAHGEKQ